MELRKAKRKNIAEPRDVSLFPCVINGKCTAVYIGHCTYVKSDNYMLNLFYMGFYGTGTLSRGEPDFDKREHTEIILEQQLENRQQIQRIEVESNICGNIQRAAYELQTQSISNFMQSTQDFSYRSLPQTSSFVPARSYNSIDNYVMQNFLKSCSDDEEMKLDKCDHLRQKVNEMLSMGMARDDLYPSPESVIVVREDGPTVETAPPRPHEMFVLDLQETFFLASALGVLNVVDKVGMPISIPELWAAFQKKETNFLRRYLVYYWYRSKGWIVRSGLKQGGDFVLYEKGPPYCHSSYVVRVCSGSCLKWTDLAALQRLVETFKKDILVCYVLPLKKNEGEVSKIEPLSNYRIAEVMWRRWIPSQQRVVK